MALTPLEEDCKVGQRSYPAGDCAPDLWDEYREGHSEGMAIYPIASGWELEVLDEARGWCLRRSDVTLPAPSVLTGYGALSQSDYSVQARYTRSLRWPSERGERVFLHFDGLLNGATVLLDGVVVGTSRGGYTAERFEVTHRVPWGRMSTLHLEIDSRQRVDLPPFGRPPRGDCPGIDFHTFGGVSRAPAVEITPAAFVSSVRALPHWGSRRIDKVDVTCFLDWVPPGWGMDVSGEPRLEVFLVQDGSVLAKAQCDVPEGKGEAGLTLKVPPEAKLWSPEAPALADLHVEMSIGEGCHYRWDGRIGLRVASFEADGLWVNGRHFKVLGLSRHELFPYLGACAPSRLHRMDVRTIKEVLGCNLVRTAHYPQSPEFLDACDEAGLMVFEETPGWGYLGDREWREVVCRDVAAMVRRDWNHPSVVMWGIRCNEAPHDEDLYSRTNRIAHELDPSRPTGGARVMGDYAAPIIEDVSCFNDYGEVPLPPNHQPYLVSEFVGAITPAGSDATGHVYHRSGPLSELMQQGLRHARFYDGVCAAAAGGTFAGGIGWLAFDYQSPCGSKRRWRDVKTPGVCDLFRIPKLAAGFYSSQRDISQGVVVEANFLWDETVDLNETEDVASTVWVWTNADKVCASVDGKVVAIAEPDRETFPHLSHPPVPIALPALVPTSGSLTLQGLLGDAPGVEKSYSPLRAHDVVYARAEDTEIFGDGSDATRVVVGVTDRFGNPRFMHAGVLRISVEGPGEIIGPSELDLAEIGGIGATFVAATSSPCNVIKLMASCEGVGSATATLHVKKPVVERL